MTDDADRELVLVGDHPEVLASGTPLQPGARVLEADLRDDEGNLADEDARLIDEGLLRDVAEFAPTELTGDALAQRAADLEIPRRTKLTADELREAIAAREAELAAEAAAAADEPTTPTTEGGAS